MRASLTTLLLWSAGSVVSVECTKRCSSFERPNIIAHAGNPVGEVKAYDGANLYVSKPSCKEPKVGVLYITDVFGLPQATNKLLTDSFARAGFLAVAPDLFNGDEAPSDLTNFNITAWSARHGPDVTEPILRKGLDYLRAAGVDKIATAGYCYGGRYAFRLLNPAGGWGVDAAYAAHPSFLGDDEISAITKPASIAAAEIDEMIPTAKLAQIEDLLKATGQPYQVNFYSGTSHGFATRANISDPEQKYGKETAFYQAVRWFDAWAAGNL